MTKLTKKDVDVLKAIGQLIERFPDYLTHTTMTKSDDYTEVQVNAEHDGETLFIVFRYENEKTK